MSKRNFKWKKFFRLLKEDMREAWQELRFQCEAWCGMQLARFRARQRRKAYAERQAQHELSKPLRYWLSPFGDASQSRIRKERER